MNNKSDGFTLVELLIGIAILGIIAAVTVPRVTGIRDMAEESVCATNRKTVERMYEVFLAENELEHSDIIFSQYLIDNFEEICPSTGIIKYGDGRVNCGVHGDEGGPPEEDSSGEEVPWL